MRTAAERLPEFLSSLVSIGKAKLAERAPKLPRTTADQVMREVAAELVARYRCSEIYVAADTAGARAMRDQRIRSAYLVAGPQGTPAQTPQRVRELATEHGLSPRRVRSIVNTQTDRRTR